MSGTVVRTYTLAPHIEDLEVAMDWEVTGAAASCRYRVGSESAGGGSGAGSKE